MDLIDLSDRLDDEHVLALLRQSAGTRSSAVRALARFRAREWMLLGYEERGVVVACIGVEPARRGAEVALHSVAVTPERRRQGLGRSMIGDVRRRFGGAILVAETDAEAVGFYRRCGFAVETLGERYPGTERFRCSLRSG